MLKPILFITIAFALVVASTLGARADICFYYTNGGGISVAKGVDLPGRNECVSLALYEAIGPANPPSTLVGAGTGTLCTSQGGRFAVLHYTYHNCIGLGGAGRSGESYFESGTCQLRLTERGGNVGELPTTTPNTCRGTVIRGKPGQAGTVGAFFLFDAAKIEKCDGKDPTLEVPSGDAIMCFLGNWVDRLAEPEPAQPKPGAEQEPAQPKPGPDTPKP